MKIICFHAFCEYFCLDFTKVFDFLTSIVGNVVKKFRVDF